MESHNVTFASGVPTGKATVSNGAGDTCIGAVTEGPAPKGGRAFFWPAFRVAF